MAGINTYIHGDASYQVLAPCVVAELVGGGQQYIYKNGILPRSTRPALVEHLLEQGMIRALEGVSE